jgi:hypothetical protein
MMRMSIPIPVRMLVLTPFSHEFLEPQPHLNNNQPITNLLPILMFHIGVLQALSVSRIAFQFQFQFQFEASSRRLRIPFHSLTN